MEHFEEIEKALMGEKDAMLAFNLVNQKCTQMRNLGLTEMAEKFSALAVKLAQKATSSGRQAQYAGLLIDRAIQEAYEKLRREQSSSAPGN